MATARKFEAELEIHDYPSDRRWEVAQKKTLEPILEATGASSIQTRGHYIAPGKVPESDQKKLYMVIKGPTEESVENAKAALLRVLEGKNVSSHAHYILCLFCIRTILF